RNATCRLGLGVLRAWLMGPQGTASPFGGRAILSLQARPRYGDLGWAEGAGERARATAMAIALSANGRSVAGRTAIAWPAQSRLKLRLDEGFDPVAHPLAHAGLDRVDPIVEKPGLRLAGRMHCICLADKVGHGVVSHGTGALQRPNPAVWVATPGDYATLLKVRQLAG